jgi:hydrogenase maturation protease
MNDHDELTPGSARREKPGKSSITIVGIGNEFRGDDGAALHVLRSLKEIIPAQIALVELTGDQSDLIELMQDTDNMIIVDAVCSQAPPGTIFHINASKDSFPGNFFTVSTHGIDLSQSIEMARTMNRLPEVVLVYGIVGKNFSFSTSLSQQVRDSAETVKNKILNDVDRILITPDL